MDMYMVRAGVWLLVATALGLSLAHLGNVFPDEGWYLYAGQRVADGAIPYRDFAHFQAPLTPYLLAPAHGDRDTGRLIGLAFGIGAIALALDLPASGKGGAGPSRDRALAATALLVVPATYTLRWYALCRNIAPAAFFLTLGVWLAERRGRPYWAAAAMAVASGFRMSAIGGLVALVLWRGAVRKREALGVIAAGAVSLAAVFGPFFALAPGPFVFNNLLYHVGLHSDLGWAGQVWAKLNGLFRLADHHHALVLALAIAAWGFRLEAGLEGRVALAVTALHLIPGRLHPEYHELVVPLLAVVAGRGHQRWFGLKRCWMIPLIALQFLGARAHLHTASGWSPTMIADVGTVLARVAPEGEPVLTFVPDFALEADLPLLPGLEMGSVSLARPETDIAGCARLHVVTLASLARDLRAGRAGAVVWRALEDADPRRTALYPASEIHALETALRARYRPIQTLHGWTIWRRSSP